MDRLEILDSLDMHPEKQTQLLKEILAELQKMNDHVKSIDNWVNECYGLLINIAVNTERP